MENEENKRSKPKYRIGSICYQADFASFSVCRVKVVSYTGWQYSVIPQEDTPIYGSLDPITSRIAKFAWETELFPSRKAAWQALINRKKEQLNETKRRAAEDMGKHKTEKN